MPDATLRNRASGLLAGGLSASGVSPQGLLTASGRSDVPPFMVMDVMAAAARIEAAGGRVIHMEVGQPAAPAPKAAIAAARAALESGRIDYTSALGIPSLRERIARHYRETYRCAVDAERIVVTTGSSGAFVLAFLAMFEPGDRVAVTVPGAHRFAPRRRCLLPLCRCFEVHLRQPGLCRRDAGKGRCCRNPGHRLRSDPRPCLHTVLLRTLGGGDARGGRAPRAMAGLGLRPG
jgi:hypothetical protein